MKASELVKYLNTVIEEAGDIPVIVMPAKAHGHILECPEVLEKARYWGKEAGTEVLKRAKAVVVR